MQVVCKDGTTIQCSDFEAIDSGVLLYQEQGTRDARSEEEDEAEETERRATGFVPITELKFVLPEELLGARGQQAAPERGRTAPPGAPTGAGGQVAQQQQMQQQPGAPGQNPYDTGGR
ncbi:MAG: hypothetical protein ABEJ26_14360 [Halosimplex sp.]